MSAVEARFAGGHVTVTSAVLPATGMPVVVMRAPTEETPLQPDEARVLARVLLEHAHRVEQEDEVTPWP
jgi:hypothetical protein